MAGLTPATPDMPLTLDQLPFAQESPSVGQMSPSGGGADDDDDDDNVPESFRPATPRSTGAGFLLQDVIHLFHCHLCHELFTEPVTLPCGRSICKRCMPQAHVRSRISYPAVDDRLEGFRCPFKSCAKEHTLGDCGIDVTLNKLAEHIRGGISLLGPKAVRRQPDDAVAAQLRSNDPAPTQPRSTLTTDSSDQPMDPSSEHDHESSQRAESDDAGSAATKQSNHQPSQHTEPDDSKPAATKEHGHQPLQHAEPDDAGPAATQDHEDSAAQEHSSFTETQQLTRSELDCQVCYALFHDPLTTGCGHTFCRSCLHRILDHSRYCPLCRRRLSISPLLNRVSCPSNASLTRIIETFWTDELAERRSAIEAEERARLQDLETPLFVCTLAFPQMPTFLHVFEPRYRLLVRRALEGDKTFGMVLGRRPRHVGDATFHELGTLLRIENAQFFPDGRCLIETVGLSRFRVLRHGSLDGYVVSSVQRVDDISLEEEEATEAAEMAAAAAADAAPFPPPPPPPDADSLRYASSNNSTSTTATTTTTPRAPITVPSLETMATRDLMQLATDFVARMREQSVPWMTDRMLAIYGECPVHDPAVFPWWLASVLPVRDAEKFRLLGSASVRERLKICCRWIIEWETKTWYATAAEASRP